MSAKPADRWFHQQRTFQDRQLGTKKSTDTQIIFKEANKMLILLTYI